MANNSSSFVLFSKDQGGSDLELIKALVISVNEYILEFLSNKESWNSLKRKCSSKLNIQKHEFFEFSEHSVLSNLYWGIENIEAAMQAKCSEDKTNRLRNSERMLQVPALLDEDGVTAGIQNLYLVCCSYFYLSVVRKLQNDEWQVGLHFFQALLVSPRLVRMEFAPELCESLFFSLSIGLDKEKMSGGKRRLLDDSVADFDEDIFDEAVKKMAKRCKHWLMYYQVMSYGMTSQEHCRSRDNSSLADESQFRMQMMNSSTNALNSTGKGHCLPYFANLEKVHPFDSQEHMTGEAKDEHKACKKIQKFQNFRMHLDQVPKIKDQNESLDQYTSIKSLQKILMESHTDAQSSISSGYDYYLEECDSEENMDDAKSSMVRARNFEDDLQPYVHDHDLHGNFYVPCSTFVIPSQALQCSTQEKAHEVNASSSFADRILSSMSDIDVNFLETGDKMSNTQWSYHIEDVSARRASPQHKVQVIDQAASKALQSLRLTEIDHHRRAITKTPSSHNQRNFNNFYLHSEDYSKMELMTILEKAISKLCFSEGLAKCEEEYYAVEVSTIYEMLNNKRGVKYSMLKDVILDQLLAAISTSKEERVIRASVSILTTIISVNKSAVEDVKKKGLRLCDLATALKRNVHEAAILIYLINPSPAEIMTLELLPELVGVVCTSNSYREKPPAVLLTPPAASLMIIEVLVTAFDSATNNMHLAEISSPPVLCKLLDVARNNDIEEYISLCNILVKCMQFDGQCRNHVSQFIPVTPFRCLLQSTEKRAKFAALEFFHEVLRMPRSLSIGLLQKIRKEGSANIMQILIRCVQTLQPDYKLLAANLLLQLDMLESSSGKSMFIEEAMQIILKAVTSEENLITQQLAAYILANIGGTYAWTGEPYTVAWLVKKAGLTSMHYRNMIIHFDWLDPILQDAGIDSWCSKVAKCVIAVGKPVFQALEKGLKSKVKKVSRDSLTAIAWIGLEIARCPYSLRCSACEILLDGIEQFLHPGLDLEERLLACMCIYNYASGRGMQKIVHFSEGVRESLRRFSNVTWMAEELHRVADYYLPNKSRISCVHTQILEANYARSGAVTALIYYRGLLCGGYSDGSIKVWDMKQQSSTLVLDIKEHKKEVTCFSLLEAGDSLLSGSTDKTIRVWKMVQKKLECIEVITMKEPIQKIETYGQKIFVLNQGHGIKVVDSFETVRDICKTKKVKCMSVVEGKVYTGCMDSSIQEFSIANGREHEIRPATKSWRMQNKPINSIVVYRDWLYSASSIVEGSKLKEWRAQFKPQISIATDKGRSVLAMNVVEDFIYLNCSSSVSTLQIWLRGTQQKVGRISAGSRITSLLTANDIVLCGTEKGLIKGWIPL